LKIFIDKDEVRRNGSEEVELSDRLTIKTETPPEVITQDSKEELDAESYST